MGGRDDRGCDPKRLTPHIPVILLIPLIPLISLIPLLISSPPHRRPVANYLENFSRGTDGSSNLIQHMHSRSTIRIFMHTA